MKFGTVRIYFLSEFSVCCHPKILLPWQRDVTTSPLYLTSRKNGSNFRQIGKPLANVFFPFPLNRALGTWRSDALVIILKDERLLVFTETYKQPNTLLYKYDQIHHLAY